MQRVGRSGHAQFRIVVQESRLSPSSHKVVALLGHYNPHTKVSQLDLEAAQKYLNNGAQPSGRVIKILKAEKIKLPSWVKPTVKKSTPIKHPEKLRTGQKSEQKSENDVKPEISNSQEKEVQTDQSETKVTNDTELTSTDKDDPTLDQEPVETT